MPRFEFQLRVSSARYLDYYRGKIQQVVVRSTTGQTVQFSAALLQKFITPDELYDLIRRAGLDPVDRKGMVFNPVSWSWSLSAKDLSVNYVTASVKRGGN